MNRTFKFSTFVIKLMFFAFILASFGLSAVKASPVTENDKMVLGSLRLSLWYQGIDGKSEEVVPSQGKQKDSFGVEELDRAMSRYSKSQHSFDAKR